ncbi:MAG TPA: iron-containing alcohol dehydrogenase [Solirubrobacteraceae bacterium]|nr:iron-containing alcohol dehydrogenase [Solirubrobacteraceae bacterium]
MSVIPPIDLTPFRWRDGERLIVFGRGRLSEAPDLLDEPFTLLTTSRARALVPDLVGLAAGVHEVPAGRVDEIAGELRSRVEGALLVALGGGRVIDTAKALAAADPPRRVVAIPTTLSGAEMTAIHRHAAGVSPETERVRPAIVLSDPALSASQPVPDLAQSAGNALGHAVEGPATNQAHPVSALTGLAAAQLIAQAFSAGSVEEAERDALGLGAVLAGYSIGTSGYGLHHVVSQTLARFAGVPHGAANTIMLPHTIAALARRRPEWNERLSAGLRANPAELARRLLELGGLTGLQAAGVSEDELEVCAEQAAERPELAMTPPAADAEELRALYRAAY